MNYVYHHDIPNGKWNTFSRAENGQEDFLQAFDLLEDAKDFCDINNGVNMSTSRKPAKKHETENTHVEFWKRSVTG